MRRRRLSAVAARARDERGSVSTELVLLTPLLILILLIAVDFGRLAGARLDADEAAHQAARAASLARSGPQGNTEAQSAATASLNGAGSSCRNPHIAAITGGFQPGSVVTVRVTCHVDPDTPGLPDHTIAARATSVVDLYRGVRG
ncbi:pilus assembly protein [Streptomyces sp. NBC_00006]|uniref:TadE/TadG family type IV pilus assembly protein n=1 Tax=unclassified Streptomyces TaxID=2593676 RepID=UPI002254D652|nr:MULTISPECIES: TadE/TadG family type IV pilus assembly protein [unclassified Streptomyces]MCX4834222.1 pilus assembly protein [Streptomyces sp. NBC_01016]MCX5529862.1 pilus assembly protein [Streptomyces sp. NBC_00006]